MQNAILNNPRKGTVAYHKGADRTELYHLVPGPNELDVETVKAIRATPLTASGKVGPKRSQRTLTQGEWLDAMGVTTEWPEPAAEESTQRRAR